MSLPRQIVPGRYYLITRRCAQRQFLLRPGTVTNAVFEFLLAEAAALFKIELVAWMAMSNHYHAVVHDPLGRLPHFLERFHQLVARSLNAHWGRWESFWSGSEPPCVTHLVTPEDVFDKVVYTLANPALGHLVDRVADWPGASALHALEGRAKHVSRPNHFFRAEGPVRETVDLTAKPPRFDGETGSAWAARVRAAVERVERRARAERQRTGQRVVGRTAILAASFLDQPMTREPRRALRPNVACADPGLRVDALAALKAFRAAYRWARDLFSMGVRDVPFPCGTWDLRRLGVHCERAAPS